MVCEIGIRHPLREGLWGRLQIRNGSVVTSGTYERFFEIKGRRYCHIVDPETGHPVDSNLTSVTMYDPSGAMADALATSVFVMGEEAAWKLLESRPQSQMIVIRSDGTWKASPGLLPLLTVF